MSTAEQYLIREQPYYRSLITVACNEDMTASDLVGRYLLDATGTRWQDGPLTTAAPIGAVCYLDEVVEARQGTARWHAGRAFHAHGRSVAPRRQASDPAAAAKETAPFGQ